MFKSLSYDQFKELAKNNPYVVVYRELLADTFTPISAFECLNEENTDAMLLESGLRFNSAGADSFIGLSPYATFLTKNGRTTICHPERSEGSPSNICPINPGTDPLNLLREFHKKYRSASDEASKHAANMMGFFAYDAVRYFENIPDRHKDDADFPDILFHFYRINLVFNHESNKLLIAVVAEINQNPQAAYQNACEEIETVLKKLKQSSPSVPFSSNYPEEKIESFSTDCDDALFAEKVAQAQSHIQAGDAFQIVLSRKFSKPITANPLSIYRILRYSNPTPYMFFLTTPKFVCFGASPEKLVSVQNKIVTIAPIAGTFPNSDETNEVLTERLQNDMKQRAEHIMLVDLARNDIGAVCEPGSVHVRDLMRGLRLTHVVHMVSYVEGKLSDQYDTFDLIKFTFPAGTLSGAPKIRAMGIIDELETSKRHLYGGAVCKIDSKSNLDSCIIIRSGVVKDGMINVRAGAGIVFDSKPLEEAEETQHKAKGLLKAIQLAERGDA